MGDSEITRAYQFFYSAGCAHSTFCGPRLIKQEVVFLAFYEYNTIIFCEIQSPSYMPLIDARFTQNLGMVAMCFAVDNPVGGAWLGAPQPVGTSQQRSDLPLVLSPLIGRVQELAILRQLLQREEVRLLTLTGVGGAGKTRLSLQLAAELQSAFSDGVYFVALAALRNANLVLAAIAQTIGVLESSDQPLLESLKRVLRERQLLLILDNFEQVMAAAPLIAALLTAAPRLRILITSRTLLHLSGEHELPIPPLALPDREAPTTTNLAQNPAVTLFIQRAQAVRPNLQLTDENAAAIAEICWRLDGLPLAIELAAARCRILSPQALLARLLSPLQLLTTGSQDLPPRQQTLRATIDWSYQLLTPAEQSLFRRLAIFVGGWTLDAAEEVCATVSDAPTFPSARPILSTNAVAVLDHLTVLIDHSLVQQAEEPDGEPRFTMLETLREYAFERLEESGEAPLLRQLHLHFYLALAEAAENKLTGREQLTWLTRLEREHDNLRAALTNCRSIAGGEELALRLATALSWFWELHGHVSEGRAWLENLLARTALEMPARAFVSVRATALYRTASMANAQSDHQRALALANESLTLFHTLGDVNGMGWAHYMLGLSALLQGNYPHAATQLQESLTLFRATGDALGIGWSLNELGSLAMMRGDYAQAAIHHAESLAIARNLGNARDIAIHQVKQAMLMQAAGDYRQAVVHLEESLALFRQLGDRQNIPLVLHSLAYAFQLQNDFVRAQTFFREALQLYERIGNRFGIARCLIGLAASAEATGQFTRAAGLYGAAAAQHDNLNAFLEPGERDFSARSQGVVQERLGESAYSAAWNAGQTMTPTQALAASEPATTVAPAVSKPVTATPIPATTAPMPATPPTVTTGSPLGLSEREVEVLRLLARGLSYAEIADQLVISPRTVNRHLTSIYTKLNVTSRHAATRFALDHGLS